MIPWTLAPAVVEALRLSAAEEAAWQAHRLWRSAETGCAYRAASDAYEAGIAALTEDQRDLFAALERTTL